MCEATKDSRFGFTIGDAVTALGTRLKGRVTGFDENYVRCDMGRGFDNEGWNASSLRHAPEQCDPKDIIKARPGGVCNTVTFRSSEQTMVDMIREDLGVAIDPQAWRMFVRSRFGRLSPLAHRIHEGRS